jgi:hypothetical protein
VTTRDAFLQIAGKHGAHATVNVEYGGPGIASLSINARKTPTCGACVGGHMGVIGADEVCITATTRNFKGRMGDPSSKLYMGSTSDRGRLGTDRLYHRSARIPELKGFHHEEHKGHEGIENHLIVRKHRAQEH